jgi:hypothetical protein
MNAKSSIYKKSRSTRLTNHRLIPLLPCELRVHGDTSAKWYELKMGELEWTRAGIVCLYVR